MIQTSVCFVILTFILNNSSKETNDIIVEDFLNEECLIKWPVKTGTSVSSK